MSFASRIVQLFGWFQWRVVSLKGNLFSTRTKKLTWLFIFVVILFLYLSSSHFLPAHRHLHSTQLSHRKVSLCLVDQLKKWYRLMETADAVVKLLPTDSAEHEFLPFTGNGFIGLTMDSRNKELLCYQKARTIHYMSPDHNIWPLRLPVFPIVEAKLKGSTTEPDEAVVLDLTDGVIHYFSSYFSESGCVVIENIIYVHRKIQSALIQQTTVTNQRGEPVYVSFYRQPAKDWKDMASERISLAKKEKKEETFILNDGPVKLNEADHHNEMYVAIAMSDVPDNVEVSKISSKTLNIMTTARAEYLFLFSKDKDQNNKDRKAVAEQVKREFEQLTATEPDHLYNEHMQAWQEIWKLGMTLDSKDDPDIPSAIHVNVTEYYLYSSSKWNDTKTSKLQSRTGTCFYGPPTMHSAEFWVLPSEMKSLVKFVENWEQTLINFGCVELLRAGLFGFQEALVLSFSGLQFTRHGLELAVNPNSLHSNVSVRHLPYLKKELYLKIIINRASNIKTVHILSVGNNDPKLYTCGAGCERISELGNTPVIFRVWLTSPVTPILYVSSNKSSLEQVKKSSFIKIAKARGESNRLPAFAAHHFKLSAKFWFAVAFLIVSFHVVVVKMICTECRTERAGGRRRGRAYPS